MNMLLTDGFDLDALPKLHTSEGAFNCSGDNHLRVLSDTMDGEGNKEIEYLPSIAKAETELLSSDPELMPRSLKSQSPYLYNGKTLRLFHCDGDSMLPLPKSCKILGERVEDLRTIEDGALYLVMSRGGYAIKKVYKKHYQALTLKSLNPIYSDYNVAFDEITEVWKFVLYTSGNSKRIKVSVYAQELLEKIEEMRHIVSKGILFIA